jgi:hypothetical protein
LRAVLAGVATRDRMLLQYVKIPIPTTAAISIAPRLETGHFVAQG